MALYGRLNFFNSLGGTEDVTLHHENKKGFDVLYLILINTTMVLYL